MRKNKNLTFIVVLIVIILAVESVGMTTFSALDWFWNQGYTSGYQGAKGRFAGVRFPTAQEFNPGTPGVTQYQWPTTGSYFSFDMDAPNKQLPDVIGEMSSVFIPSETIGESPSWIPDWLIREATTINNPRHVYDEWQFEEPTEYTFYRMENWRLVWFITFGSHGTFGGTATADDEIPPASGFPFEEKGRWSYKDLEVWLELDLTPVWYFEGAQTAYFAIAKAMVGESGAVYGQWEKKGSDRDYTTRDSDCSVIPESAYTVLPIYYSLFGEERADKEAYDYQGKTLNPDLFTDKVYTYVNLNDFGVSSGWNPDLSFYYRGDVVTYMLYVDVFVVGEWTVQDIEDLPDWFGRGAQTGLWGGILGVFRDLLSDPFGRIIFLIVIAVVLFFIIAMFFPWIIILLGGGGRRR